MPARFNHMELTLPVGRLQETREAIAKFYGDLFGLIGLIGVGMALYRRYFSDFHRIRWDERVEDHAIIAGLGLILITGFLIESFRIYTTELNGFVLEDGTQLPAQEDWARWSFVSWGLAEFWQLFDLSQKQALAAHTWGWWGHAGTDCRRHRRPVPVRPHPRHDAHRHQCDGRSHRCDGGGEMGGRTGRRNLPRPRPGIDCAFQPS